MNARRRLVALAKRCDDTDEIAVLTREVIDSGDVWTMVAFAAEVPGADTDALREAVRAADASYATALFASEVDGATMGGE